MSKIARFQWRTPSAPYEGIGSRELGKAQLLRAAVTLTEITDTAFQLTAQAITGRMPDTFDAPGAHTPPSQEGLEYAQQTGQPVLTSTGFEHPVAASPEPLPIHPAGQAAAIVEMQQTTGITANQELAMDMAASNPAWQPGDVTTQPEISAAASGPVETANNPALAAEARKILESLGLAA